LPGGTRLRVRGRGSEAEGGGGLGGGRREGRYMYVWMVCRDRDVLVGKLGYEV
jgi:hypothetical protein